MKKFLHEVSAWRFMRKYGYALVWDHFCKKWDVLPGEAVGVGETGHRGFFEIMAWDK